MKKQCYTIMNQCYTYALGLKDALFLVRRNLRDFLFANQMVQMRIES